MHPRGRRLPPALVPLGPPSCPLKSSALPAATRGLTGAEALELGHGLWQPRVPLRRPPHTCSPCLSPRTCLTCPGRARGLSHAECPRRRQGRWGSWGAGKRGAGQSLPDHGPGHPRAGAWRSVGQPRCLRGPGGVRGAQARPCSHPSASGPCTSPTLAVPSARAAGPRLLLGTQVLAAESRPSGRGSPRPGCAEEQGSPSPLGLGGACPQSRAWAGGGVLCLGLRGWCRGAQPALPPCALHPGAQSVRLLHERAHPSPGAVSWCWRGHKAAPGSPRSPLPQLPPPPAWALGRRVGIEPPQETVLRGCFQEEGGAGQVTC